MSGTSWTARRLGAAQALAQDRVTAEVLGALADAGVPAVLLKGPALARWLYADGAERRYGDTDVLVPAARRDDAAAVLAALGFAARLKPSDVARALHAHPWRRERDGAVVDLHVTIAGMQAPPDAVFAALPTEPLTVGGRDVPALAPGARALHVALHAAHDGVDGGKPLRDLERAVGQLDRDVWREAAALARVVEAEEALGAGLRLAPDGAAIADALGVTRAQSTERRLLAASAPREALTVEQLASTRGAAARARIVLNRVVPPPSYLRFRHPLARRGPAGLVLAYLWRPVSLALRAPRAISAWRRAARSDSA
jgi:hypothetical protein